MSDLRFKASIRAPIFQCEISALSETHLVNVLELLIGSPLLWKGVRSSVVERTPAERVVTGSIPVGPCT
jgi:hypothetical protein